MPINPSIHFDFAGETDVGCVRANNQDAFLIAEALGFCAVADGVGGAAHGEVAARLALETAKYYMTASSRRNDASWPFGFDFATSVDHNRIRTAFELANRQVFKRVEQSPECSGMGTTLVGVILDGEVATVGNVGDSRAYWFHAGELTQVTEDDSFVGVLRRSGAISAEEAASHAMRNVLTQALGTKDGVTVQVRELRMAPGDLLMLCSDGVHGVLDEGILRSILFSCQNLEKTARQIVDAVRARGAPDNLTCVLIRMTGLTTTT